MIIVEGMRPPFQEGSMRVAPQGKETTPCYANYYSAKRKIKRKMTDIFPERN